MRLPLWAATFLSSCSLVLTIQIGFVAVLVTIPASPAGAEMDPRGLPPAVQVLGYHALPVAVCEEVDGSSRHDADQVGTQALEQSSGAFLAVDGSQYLHRFVQVVARRPDWVHGGGMGSPGRSELRLVEVGLEARLEHV